MQHPGNDEFPSVPAQMVGGLLPRTNTGQDLGYVHGFVDLEAINRFHTVAGVNAGGGRPARRLDVQRHNAGASIHPNDSVIRQAEPALFPKIDRGGGDSGQGDNGENRRRELEAQFLEHGLAVSILDTNPTHPLCTLIAETFRRRCLNRTLFFLQLQKTENHSSAFREAFTMPKCIREYPVGHRLARISHTAAGRSGV